MIALAALMISAGCAFAKDIQKVTVTTEPQMHCSNCEAKIKNFFKFEKGIKKIETSVPDQRVTITFDADKTSKKKIVESFGKIEYKATEVCCGEEKACGGTGKCDGGKSDDIIEDCCGKK